MHVVTVQAVDSCVAVLPWSFDDAPQFIASLIEPTVYDLLIILYFTPRSIPFDPAPRDESFSGGKTRLPDYFL